MLRLIGRLCCFLAGPQDVPHSVNSLRFILALNLLVQFLILWHYLPAPISFLGSLISVGTLLALPWLVLAFVNKMTRFVQTATALQMINVALTALLIIMMNLFASWPVGLVFYSILSFIWGASLFSHTLKEATDLALWQAVLIILIFIVLRQVIIMALF